MEGTKIEIDLAQFFGTREDEFSLADAVIAEAARQALDANDGLRFAVRDRVTQLTDDELRAKIGPMITEALNGAIQTTNTFGERKGDPTTLREVIVEKTRKWLTDPDPDARSPMGGGRRPTRVESMIAKEVASAVKTDLRDAMNTARAEVISGVKDHAAAVLAETIARSVAR